jgi:hypothetical protein
MFCNKLGVLRWWVISSPPNPQAGGPPPVGCPRLLQYIRSYPPYLEAVSSIRNLYRGINEFKKVYQPRTNLVKDERHDLLADPHRILNRWKNYFRELLNVRGAAGVRQTEIYTVEPFVPEPSASEVEVTIGKLKRYNSPGVDQITAELIKAGWETLHSEIHKLIKLVWNKELPHQWKKSIVVPIQKRVTKLTLVINKAYHCRQLRTKFYEIFFSLG